MNDDFINQFDKPKPPRKAFAAALYQRINEPMQPPARTPFFRTLAIALAVVTVLAAALLVSPPGRAFADGIIRRVGFYTFVQGEEQPDPAKQALRDQGSQNNPATGKVGAPADPKNRQEKATAAAKSEKDIASAPDTAAASQMAGFPVLAPAYLPQGYTPTSDWMMTQQGDHTQSVSIGYESTDHQVLWIDQAKSDANTPAETFTLPEVQDVTVRGQPGVWLPGGKHSLLWVENGVTYRISSSALDLDETLKIAESLGK